MVREEELIELAHPESWDARYTSDQKTAEDGTLHSYEWFRDFGALRPFFEKHLPAPSSKCHILHLGCGNSVCFPLCEKSLCYPSKIVKD
jgi:hypothetical protein